MRTCSPMPICIMRSWHEHGSWPMLASAMDLQIWRRLHGSALTIVGLQAETALSRSKADCRAANASAQELRNQLELERLQCAGIRAMMDELQADLEAHKPLLAEVGCTPSIIGLSVRQLPSFIQLIIPCDPIPSFLTPNAGCDPKFVISDSKLPQGTYRYPKTLYSTQIHFRV